MPTKKKTAKQLTAKQKIFIDQYLSNGFNATAAAREAGYSGSDNTLSSMGYENLRKPEIASEVLARLNESAMSANECLAIISRQARGSISEVLNDAGQFDFEVTKERGADRLIKKLKIRHTVTTTQNGATIDETTHELELHDAQAAATLIGKHHKLFTDRREVGGFGGGPVRLEVVFDDELKGSEDE